MKLQKTLVAVAIAGIAASPMIASADTTLSGAVQLNLNGSDAEDIAADPANDIEAESPGDLEIKTGDVLVGIVAEQEMNSGLTGYGSLRIDLDQLSNTGTDVTADSVYVGVKGGFGDVRIGEIGQAIEYGQTANDIYGVGGEINAGIGYTGVFGPVSFGLNYSPARNNDMYGAGVKFNIGGFAIGLGVEDRNELMNASAGVSFAYAGASIAAHYWTKAGAESNVAGEDDDPDTESVSVKVGYSFGGIGAGLTYSTKTDDAAVDLEVVRLDLSYGLGGGMEVSSRITSETDNNDGEKDSLNYRVQLAKSF